MVSSGMLRHVALVRTNVSEELSGSFISSVRQLLLTASVVPSSPILVTLMKEALSSSEMSVLTTATPFFKAILVKSYLEPGNSDRTQNRHKRSHSVLSRNVD
jgi:hypothetical protein